MTKRRPLLKENASLIENLRLPLATLRKNPSRLKRLLLTLVFILTVWGLFAGFLAVMTSV